MFYQKFLIRLACFITFVQLVNGAALTKDKDKGKGGKPAEPKSTSMTTSTETLPSWTSDKVAPTSAPAYACSTTSTQPGKNEGNCILQKDAPWALQRISQIPWKSVAYFLAHWNHHVFSFRWYSSWGKDVILQWIYVIDTGVNAGHDAFELGQVEGGARVSSYKGVPDPMDHGTGIASCIVGKLNGVARQGKIFPITMPSPSLDEDMKEALTIARNDWKARSSKNPNLRAVVNISWEMVGDIPTVAALESVISSGMHVLYSAGNHGEDRCYNSHPMGSPTRGPRMVGQITVSGFSVHQRQQAHIVSAFLRGSNYGPCIDVLAPGVQMMAAFKNGYQDVKGTSYATALTSGVVAALLSSHPGYRNLNPVDFRKKFMVELTKKGLTQSSLPPNTENRMLTIEELLNP